MKLKLLEMSLSKSELASKLQDKTPILNEHLIKCLIIQNANNNLNHWCLELWSFLSYVPTLKGSNKLPDTKMLKRNTIDYFGDSLKMRLNRQIKYICDEENISINNYDIESLYTCIIRYYQWMISLLSKYGNISKQEISQEVKELIKDYNKLSSKQKVGV